MISTAFFFIIYINNAIEFKLSSLLSTYFVKMKNVSINLANWCTKEIDQFERIQKYILVIYQLHSHDWQILVDFIWHKFISNTKSYQFILFQQAFENTLMEIHFYLWKVWYISIWIWNIGNVKKLIYHFSMHTIKHL